MGQSIRVFCASPVAPTLRQVLDWVADTGVLLAIDTEYAANVDADSPDWRDVGILYREDLPPFVTNVVRASDTSALFRDEIARFGAFLADVADSAGKARVLTHLSETLFVVACQIQGDTEDDTYEAVAWFTRYFVQFHDGMTQADGEGFFAADNELLAPLP